MRKGFSLENCRIGMAPIPLNSRLERAYVDARTCEGVRRTAMLRHIQDAVDRPGRAGLPATNQLRMMAVVDRLGKGMRKASTPAGSAARHRKFHLDSGGDRWSRSIKGAVDSMTLHLMVSANALRGRGTENQYARVTAHRPRKRLD